MLNIAYHLTVSLTDWHYEC